MAKETGSNSSGGIGVVGLLGVVFVTLKLCGVIDWSWWWVTAPFWGGSVLTLVVLIVEYTYLKLDERRYSSKNRRINRKV